MIMNMNEKGRQTKLLAAIAIIAMVVCMFAVVMPSADADVDNGPISLDGAHPANTDENCPAIDEVTGLSASNLGLGNDVELTFTTSEPTADNDNVSGTIKVTGTLNKQNITYTKGEWGGDNQSDSAKAGYSLHWEYSASGQNYWLVLSAESPFTVTNASGTAGTADTVQILMMTSDTSKTRTITFGEGDSAINYTLDLTRLTFSSNTATVIGDGNSTFTSAQSFDNDVVVAGNTTLNVTLNAENSAAIDMTAGGSITILNGATLTINATVASNLSTSVYGIKSTTADLTIDGDGKLDIKINGEPTTNQGGVAASGIYAAGLKLNIECDVSILNNATSTAADGQNCYGMYAKHIKFDGSTSTIYTGNRAIYFSDSLTVTGNSNITVGAYEKGIRGSSNSSFLQVDAGSTVNANLLSQTSGTNAQGNDDRFGIKVGYVTVNGTVTTDGLRTFSVTVSTVSGTLDIDYVANGGATTVTEKNPVAIPAGLVMVTGDNGSHIKEGSDLTTITVSNNGKIVIAEGNSIVGNIAAEAGDSDPTATFGAIDQGESSTYILSSVVVTSEATFTVGSLNMVGGFSGETPIEITGEQELSGTYDAPIVIKDGGKATVLAGESATFNGPVSMESGSEFHGIGDVSGSGQFSPASGADTSQIKITSSNPGALSNMVTGGLEVTANNSGATAGADAELEKLAKDNSIIILSANYTISNKEITLPSTLTIYLNGWNIIINADGVLNLNGTTIRTGLPAEMPVGPDGNKITAPRAGTEGKIDVNTNGTFSLDGADVFAPVDADEENGAYVVLRNTKSITMSDGQVTNSVEVGFGNTVIMNSVTIPGSFQVDVYGFLEVNNSLRINYGGMFNVHQGGTATIAGSLYIAGNATVNGNLVVEGTVTTQGSGNSTSFTVGSTGTVDVTPDGSFTVSRANGTAYNNTLTVSGEFNVEGTLTMNGTLAGSINDYGTVSFNGTSNGATIYIYDGVSIIVTSVTNSLTVSDAHAATDYADLLATGTNVSEGNSVTIANAGGVTVSTSVTSYVVSGQGYYIADMTVTGTVTTTATGTVNVNGAPGNAVPVSNTESRTGTLTFIDNVTLGAGISMTITGGDVYVDGSINATATNVGDRQSPTIAVTAGSLTVNGTVDIVSNSARISGNGINAAYYTTMPETVVIGHYASFDTALSNIASAEQQTVYVYGEVYMTADGTVANGQTVIVEGILNIDAVLTASEGSFVTNNGTVEVDGTFTIENYLSTYVGTEPQADVLTTSGNSRTYMSLAAAIDSGATEITLNRNVTISEDTTIPESVTVTGSGVDVTVVADVTLTVDGALELTRGDVKLVDGTNADGEMVVTGHVIVSTYAPAAENGVSYVNLQNTVAGAYFSKRVNGLASNFISSVEYAASAVDDSVTTIAIRGNVSAGDVTFTAGRQGLTISVENIDASNTSSLTVSNMTLVGAVLDITDSDHGTITGTVTIQGTDGNNVGAIDTDRAKGFAIESYETLSATGTAYYAYIHGVVDGDLTIVSGTVTVDCIEDAAAELTIQKDDVLTIASGANLAIANGQTLTVNNGAEVSAEGTITVTGTLAISGNVIVNGTMNVTSESNRSGTVNIINGGELQIVGDLNVAAYSTSQYGKVLVDGALAIGSAPDTLGVGGAVTGNIGVDSDGYVKVYDGADITGAAFVGINGNNYNTTVDADSTEFYINDALYMTVYVVGGNTSYSDVIYAEDFALSGLNNGLRYYDADGKVTSGTGLYLFPTTNNNNGAWFTNAEMTANAVVSGDDSINDNEAVYAYAAPAGVEGIISVGNGLTLYIDGVPFSYNTNPDMTLEVGTHTVSFDVQTGYDGSNASITFNGQTVTGGQITITADMTTFNLTVSGAVPSSGTVVVDNGSGDMSLTDYLLIVLVILIVVMAIIVALRLMRS